MSAKDYGGMLERFNATDGRGDVLSISREDAARLHELPLEIYGPIFHALLGWFLTGEETRLNDPRDRAMLAGFKEHQLGNAARRGKFLNDQKEKSEKAVQARKERTHGTPTDNPRNTQVKDKAEDKEEAKAKSSSLSSGGGGKKRGGLTPPDFSALSVEEAKKVLAMDAPQVTSHAEMKAPSGKPNAEAYAYVSSPHAAIVYACRSLYPSDIDPNGFSGIYGEDFGINTDDLGNSPGEKFAKQLVGIADGFTDDSLFERALCDAAICSKDPKVKNREAFIVGRLNKVLAAVKVLDGRQGE